MEINRTSTKPRINLKEAEEVKAAVVAAAPQTEEELDHALAVVRTTGPLLGKCYRDETEGLRPSLLAALVLPRLGYSTGLRRA